MSQSYLTYRSPLGNILLTLCSNSITSLKFNDNSVTENKSDTLSNKILLQLEEYFKGSRTKFDLPLNLCSSDFNLKVWKELLKIPFGETASYKEISIQIGDINSARAVGNACGLNPIPLIIPCHRVILSSGKLGGFSAGIEIKRRLLNFEKKIALSRKDINFSINSN